MFTDKAREGDKAEGGAGGEAEDGGGGAAARGGGPGGPAAEGARPVQGMGSGGSVATLVPGRWWLGALAGWLAGW